MQLRKLIDQQSKYEMVTKKLTRYPNNNMISISAIPLFRHVDFRPVGSNQLVSSLAVAEYPRMSLVCAHIELLCIAKLAVLDTAAVIVQPVDAERSLSSTDESNQRLRVRT